MYNTIEQMPQWAKETVNKIVAAGAIAEKDKMQLSEEMLRTFVIIDR